MALRSDAMQLNLTFKAMRSFFQFSQRMILVSLLGGLLLSAHGANLESRLEDYRQSGLLLTLKELDKWHVHPNGTNAADIFQKAFELLPPQWPDHGLPFIQRDVALPLSGPLPTDMNLALAEHMKTYREAIPILHKAAAIQDCRYRADFREGFSLHSSHWFDVIQAAQLLNLDALYQLENGRTDDCLASLQSGIGTANSLMSEPDLTAQLIRLRLLRESFTLINRTLNQPDLNPRVLDEVENLLARAKPSASMRRGLIGSFCLGLSYYSLSDTDKAKFGGAEKSEMRGDIAFFERCRVSGVEQKDRSFFTETMLDAVAAMELPSSERLKRARAIQSRAESVVSANKYIGCGATLPSFQSVIRRTVEHEARVAILHTIIAIERHRLNQQEIPESLEALSSKQRESIPMDPFNNKPLRFKMLPNGYMVYSVGRDLKDDGGSEELLPNHGAAKRDLVIRIQK